MIPQRLYTNIPSRQGAGQLGAPTAANVRVSDRAVAQEFVDLMVSNGHVGIDTSRIYGEGTSEQVRAQPAS